MTTIHTLHTTIQFPTPGDEQVLPYLHSFSFLWPDLDVQTASWTSVDAQHPMLHPLIEYALNALDDEQQSRRHYKQACTFHHVGNAFLAAHWTNLSIQRVMVTVYQWMDVAAMLAMVERDAPELTAIVHPLLQLVGKEQQRLLTLLAILQGVYFSYCQTCHVQPTLVALPDEGEDEQEDQDDDYDGPFPRLVPVPDESTDSKEKVRP